MCYGWLAILCVYKLMCPVAFLHVCQWMCLRLTTMYIYTNDCVMWLVPHHILMNMSYLIGYSSFVSMNISYLIGYSSWVLINVSYLIGYCAYIQMTVPSVIGYSSCVPMSVIGPHLCVPMSVSCVRKINHEWSANSK